jgi:hypothetical protein
MTDALKTELEKAKVFCQSNNLLWFPGTNEESISTEIQWDEVSDEGMIDFLTIAQKSGAKILVADIVTNQISREELDAIHFEVPFNDVDLKEMIDEAVKAVRKNYGNIVEYSLSFFHEGVCYSYYNSADWATEYDLVDESLSGENDDDVDDLAQLN